MGTSHPIDYRLSEFVNSGFSTTKMLVEILVENYNKGNLDLGYIDNKIPLKRQSSFRLVDSEFENVFLDLIYYADSKYSGFHSNLFELKLDARGLDSPIEMTISLDDMMIDLFPDKMKEELKDRIYKDLF